MQPIAKFFTTTILYLIVGSYLLRFNVFRKVNHKILYPRLVTDIGVSETKTFF